MTANGSAAPTVGRGESAVPGATPFSVAVINPTAPRADAVIRGLQSSSMFELAVRVYRSHRRDGAGRCRSCRSRACRSRAHAATVIAAAGFDPAGVDAPARCGLRRRRQRRGAAAGCRSLVRATVVPDVRSGLSLECRGRTRRCGWSPGAQRDQPYGPQALMVAGRPLASTAKEGFVYSEHVHVASLINPYPLCGWLFCRCGARFCRWGSPDSTREYMTVCGCRLRPIDAGTIERRVYAHALGLDPELTAGRWPEAPAEVLAGLYSRIDVGGTVDDVRFVPRT